MAKILITGATVITMENKDAVIKGGEIAIDGQYIVHVGERGSIPESFVPDKVMMAGDKLALPGFVNCHTHAAMTLFRSYADDLPLMSWLEDKIWPLEARLEKEDIYWGTMLCCLEMIKSGTTTFADMYFHMNRAALAVEKCGMRADLSRGMIGTAPNALEALDYSSGLVQRWQGAANGRINIRLGPHAPYTCPPDYLRKVIAMAQDLNTGIHIHLAETQSEIHIIKDKYNATPIELMEETGLFELPVLAAHCVHLTPGDIELLAKRKVGVAHNAQSNMKLASGIAPVAELLKAGVVVGLGTDGAASNNDQDMVEEMRTASLLQKVSTGDPMALPAYQALSMATADGARVLGLKDVGVLKPGFKADIILIDTKAPHLHPRHDWVAQMVYAAHASDVETVIIDGEVIMENRHVLTIDEEEVYLEVQKRAGRLTGKH